MGPFLALALLALQSFPPKDLRHAAHRGEKFLREAEGGDVELKLMAFVDSETHIPKDLLKAVLAAPPTSVRSAALQAWALSKRYPWTQRARIAHCFQLILDAQTEDGFWSAGAAVEAPEVLVVLPPKASPFVFDGAVPKLPVLKLAPKTRAAGKGDPAQAAWAAFALEALRHARIEIPQEVLERAAQAWSGEGLDAVDVVAWRSSLLHALKKDARKDDAVLAAIERLKAAPLPTTPRGHARLYKALSYVDVERLGGRDWYAESAAALLASQKEDGSWGDVESTAWAVYFLPGWPLGIPNPADKDK